MPAETVTLRLYTPRELYERARDEAERLDTTVEQLILEAVQAHLEGLHPSPSSRPPDDAF